jgi:hypothetical protein
LDLEIACSCAELRVRYSYLIRTKTESKGLIGFLFYCGEEVASSFHSSRSFDQRVSKKFRSGISGGVKLNCHFRYVYLTAENIPKMAFGRKKKIEFYGTKWRQ